MSTKRKQVGLHANRLAKNALNPREVAFADQWEEENAVGDILSWLLGDGVKKATPSERDREVAATVIQWLGSNIGLSFIIESAKRSPEIAKWLRQIPQ